MQRESELRRGMRKALVFLDRNLFDSVSKEVVEINIPSLTRDLEVCRRDLEQGLEVRNLEDLLQCAIKSGAYTEIVLAMRKVRENMEAAVNLKQQLEEVLSLILSFRFYFLSLAVHSSEIGLLFLLFLFLSRKICVFVYTLSPFLM